MAHNIFGERFLGRREPAWHGLGTVFSQDEQLTAVQAVQRAGLDYSIDLVPLTCTVPAAGEPIVLVTGKRAVVRAATADDNQPRILGVVSDSFRVIQNADLAGILDRAGLTEQWPVETVGALGLGERVFITLALGGTEIGGEAIEEYALFSNGHDGSMALRGNYTPMRVVCQNTLDAGISQASFNTIIGHTGDVHAEFKLAANVMAMMKESREQTLARMRKLAEKQITRKQAIEIVNAAFPLPAKNQKVRMAEELDTRISELDAADQKRLTRATSDFDSRMGQFAAIRDAALGQYDRINDESATIAGTAWAAWQAVTETADWREGKGDIAANIMFGGRQGEKHRGFAAAMRVAKVS